RTAVDAVHPVRLHVVREARGAADTGDEHDVLARDPELRHEALHRGEDRVVTTARTPPDVLIRLEILLRELEGDAFLAVAVAVRHFETSETWEPNSASSSAALKGTPAT